jgi:hypothetical protein
MGEIQYVTDENGKIKFVQIPLEMWERMKIRADSFDRHDIEAEAAEIEIKEGIYIVSSKPEKDFADIVKEERRGRISRLLERSGL